MQRALLITSLLIGLMGCSSCEEATQISQDTETYCSVHREHVALAFVDVAAGAMGRAVSFCEQVSSSAALHRLSGRDDVADAMACADVRTARHLLTVVDDALHQARRAEDGYLEEVGEARFVWASALGDDPSRRAYSQATRLARESCAAGSPDAPPFRSLSTQEGGSDRDQYVRAALMFTLEREARCQAQVSPSTLGGVTACDSRRSQILHALTRSGVEVLGTTQGGEELADVRLAGASTELLALFARIEAHVDFYALAPPSLPRSRAYPEGLEGPGIVFTPAESTVEEPGQASFGPRLELWTVAGGRHALEPACDDLGGLAEGKGYTEVRVRREPGQGGMLGLTRGCDALGLAVPPGGGAEVPIYLARRAVEAAHIVALGVLPADDEGRLLAELRASLVGAVPFVPAVEALATHRLRVANDDAERRNLERRILEFRGLEKRRHFGMLYQALHERFTQELAAGVAPDAATVLATDIPRTPATLRCGEPTPWTDEDRARFAALGFAPEQSWLAYEVGPASRFGLDDGTALLLRAYERPWSDGGCEGEETSFEVAVGVIGGRLQHSPGIFASGPNVPTN